VRRVTKVTLELSSSGRWTALCR